MAARDSNGSRSLTIFWVSVLGLYLELLLIRWIGTEVRIFAYLQNTVLVVCFLGLGVGLLSSRDPVRPHGVFLPLLLLAIALFTPFTRSVFGRISNLLSVLGDVNIWGSRQVATAGEAAFSVALGLFLTLFIMLLVVDIFIPIGRVLGRAMDEHPRVIRAYSWNVGGSLAGVWLFVLLSRLHQPPFVWFIVLGFLLIPFMFRGGRLSVPFVGAVGLLVGFAVWGGTDEGALRTIWSPYQKLSLFRGTPDPVESVHGEYVLKVNNFGFQEIIDLRPEAQSRNPERFPAEQRGRSQYDIPLLVHPDPRRVLVVGAGTGNDVAGALRHGAERVTAVEIDPAIVALGRELHPERPYDDPRVRVVVDDARSFFATTRARYDVIIFGLLDAHTTTAMTNARLDHYVYTEESLARAGTLLADGGVLALSFEAQRPFIADRIAAALHDLFGTPPVVFRVPRNGYGWGGVLFLTGDVGTIGSRIVADQQLAGLIEGWRRTHPVRLSYTTPTIRDDWPYLYLEQSGVPPLFFMLTGLVGLLLVPVRRRVSVAAALDPRRWQTSHWHFFFLGAGFLLLEVQHISKVAVVLGSTWLVNAVIISGVLSMILLANALAARWPRFPADATWAGLFVVIALLYMVDLARFAFLPYVTKAVLVGALTTLPMLFSGLLFIRSFAAVERKDAALGANLLGALLGGLLQALSFQIGIRALLLVVLGLYGCAWLFRPEANLASARKPSRETEPAGLSLKPGGESDRRLVTPGAGSYRVE